MRAGAVPVRMGEIRVLGDGGVLAAIGLGSCIAVAIYDPEAGIGGLAHVLLPDPSAGREAPPGRFGSTAVPELVRALEAEGAAHDRLRAKITGGASMFAGLTSNGAGSLGQRNAAAVRAALERLSIPLLGEDVGGNWGRTIHFEVDSGRLTVGNVLRDDVVL